MSDNRPWWNHGSIQDDASSSRRVQGNDEDRKQPRGGYLYYKCARCPHTVLLQVPTPNACVSDRRQRETVSRVKARVEAASCSLDAMVRQKMVRSLAVHV